MCSVGRMTLVEILWLVSRSALIDKYYRTGMKLDMLEREGALTDLPCCFQRNVRRRPAMVIGHISSSCKFAAQMSP